MIIFWNTKKSNASAPVVYTDPGVDNVKKGVEYYYNDELKIGEYVPNISFGNSDGSNLPDVTGALLNWFQRLTFTLVEKRKVNFQIAEVFTEITFQGVWQPLHPQAVAMKPEGQRKWKWFQVHAEKKLILEPDAVIIYKGTRYRNTAKSDWQDHGYVQYELVEDYQND